MQEKKEHLFGAIENWLRSTNIESLLELKEKCAYYRRMTGDTEHYPYLCVVWQFNKGPDGQEWGEETIAKKLGITRRKVHESEWIGLHMLGWKAKHSPAYESRERVARKIDKHWHDKLKAEKELRSERIETTIKAAETLREEEKPLSLEDEIVQGTKRRRVLIDERIEEIRVIQEPIEKELKDWSAFSAVYQRLKEIENEEEGLVQRLRELHQRWKEIEREKEALIERLKNRGRLKNWCR